MLNLGTLTKLGVLNLYIEQTACFSNLVACCFQTGNGRFSIKRENYIVLSVMHNIRWCIEDQLLYCTDYISSEPRVGLPLWST